MFGAASTAQRHGQQYQTPEDRYSDDDAPRGLNDADVYADRDAALTMARHVQGTSSRGYVRTQAFY